MAEVFWGRWRKEYLSSLQERQKWSQPRRNMSVVDVVLMKGESAPRMSWPLGVVSEVYPSEDGLVRRVKNTMGSRKLTKDGKRDTQLTQLDRPIQKLVLLKEAE